MPPQLSLTVVPGRLAVDVDDDRIFFRRIERARPDQPAVDLDAVADIDLEDLGAAGEHGPDLRLEFGVVLEHADDGVLRKPDQFGQAGRVEAGVAVERPAAVRRDVVGMRAASVGRRHPFGFPAAVEARAVEIPLRGVLGRGDVVQPSARFVDAGDRT